MAKAQAAGTDPAGEVCGDAGCGCGQEAAGEEPPVACTLYVGQVGTRVQEWEAFLEATDDTLGGVVARAAIDGGVRLQFGPETDVTEVVVPVAVSLGVRRVDAEPVRPSRGLP